MSIYTGTSEGGVHFGVVGLEVGAWEVREEVPAYVSGCPYPHRSPAQACGYQVT